MHLLNNICAPMSQEPARPHLQMCHHALPLYTQSLHLCVMMAADTPSHVGAGSVQIDSSAKPLVPYPVGISGQGPARQPSRSRLANAVSAEEGMQQQQQCFRLPHSHCPLLGVLLTHTALCYQGFCHARL